MYVLSSPRLFGGFVRNPGALDKKKRESNLRRSWLGKGALLLAVTHCRVKLLLDDSNANRDHLTLSSVIVICMYQYYNVCGVATLYSSTLCVCGS